MPRVSALEYAVKLLGYRARTEKELRERLSEKQYPAETIAEAVLKLKRINLINDENFAVNYVRDKLSLSRRGPRRIYFELIKHGINRELADRATKTINNEEELETAQILLESKIRQWSKLDPLAKKRRAVGLLARRGFSGSVIRKSLERSNLNHHIHGWEV
ncbi:MAG: regulatory protein RecX [Candidatus Berkelbacteria bacterium]|nr:regulatory protein RecX [Candidatus Berkelbacteria bacterium]